MDQVRIAILGASGYTGAELLRLLRGHPAARIAALTAERNAGQPLAAVWPHLHGLALPDLRKIDAVDFGGIDMVFCALPHGTTQEVVAALPRGMKIIDLSADFRLRDITAYATWYGHAHRAAALQPEAVYGLCELNRAAVKGAWLVANPGCYPTSAQLPLIPLLKAGLIESGDIIIDAKSGASGAGRDLKVGNLYCEVAEGMQAYGVARHRHAPEIEQGLSDAVGRDVTVTFTPHLVPMNRGIFTSLYVKLARGADAAALRAEWQNIYGAEPFVRIMPEGIWPSTRQVRGTNQCALAVADDRVAGRAVILSCIDNLVKGAAGQAVQNMNIMLGLPETTGLTATALAP